MKLRSLHARLALTLLVLLLLAGGFNLYSTLVTTERYLQEVNQSMNLDLASNIAKMKHRDLLDKKGEILADGLDQLLHWMMVVNPGPQFYLVSPSGEIFAYDKMAGEVQRDRVRLEPIHRFMDQRQRSSRPTRTVLGEDPRDPSRPKVFSVAAIPPEGSLKGYLYIVLASHRVDSAAERLRESYILRLSTRNGLVYLGVVLLFGFLGFGLLTRPLRSLAARMQTFRSQEADPAPVSLLAKSDEVHLLDQTFDQMSQRIEHQMEQIETMNSSRQELIANVSHDLRTPIASLRGYLDTLALKDSVLSKSERDEYLQIAVRQSERLGTLVDELFQLTKLDAHEVEPRFERFRLAELVQDNVQRFQLKATEQGVDLIAEFDPDLPPVRADIGLMERALENLIGNALKFTPRGGSVTIELREDPNRLRVRVVDTGCGIAAEDLPHIFDRYYRSRSGNAVAQGAGLGLAITRRILELHHSQLEIQSTVDVGTTVAFSLVAEARTHQLTLADLPAPAAR